MPLRAAALARRGLALLGNVSVLLVLVGLLWWGRQYKWKVPSLASLRGVAGADESAKVDNPSEDNGTEVSPIFSGNSGLKEEEPPLFQVRLRSKETVRKAGIRTAPVEERALAQYVTANGAIDYDQTEYAELSPRAAGTVWKVLKKAGDPVRKGEVLGLVAAPSVARAKAEFLQGILQVEVRTKILHRLNEGKDAIAVKQLREAEASVAEANLRLFDNQHTLINLGLPIDLEAMRKLKVDERVHRLRILGVPEAVLRETEPNLLPTNLLPLVSPFDGEIIKRDMVLGEVVTTSQVQMIVADTRRLWIRLDVRQEDAEDVKIGQEVHLEPVVLVQKPAVGRISRIRPGVEKQTRTVHVRAEVDNPKGRLRPDTFGTGHILVRSSPRGIAVPTKAIQREDKVYFVFVRVDDTIFEQRRIVPGIRAGNFTEVRSGVRPGEIVVTAGSHLLKSAIVHSRLVGEN
jgi:cobalt-zinc-cadmium efflux system membrane fusion protein